MSSSASSSCSSGGRCSRCCARRKVRPARSPRSRNWLARDLALAGAVVLAALWLAWAVEVPHGYARMLRYFGSSSWSPWWRARADRGARRARPRMLPRPETAPRNPAIETRLALYHPVLVSIARALIFSSRHGRAAALGPWHVRLAGRYHAWPARAVQPAQLAVTLLLASGRVGGGQRRVRAPSRPADRARRRPRGRPGCARCCRCCAPPC